METAGLRPLYRATVKPEWVDYNGHMSEPWYVFVFGETSDAFYDLIGLGDAARRATHSSVYTVESHIWFLRELKVREAFLVGTRVISHDAKRVLLYHELARAGDGTVAAASEILALHVDTNGPRVVPFSAAVKERIAALAAEDAREPPPKRASRSLAFATKA
jgi:acyl-CoA thioester hydrolase